jgi:predicted nuclease with TOPRIM domain
LDDLKLFNHQLEVKLEQYRARVIELQSHIERLNENQLSHRERVDQLLKEKDELRCKMEIKGQSFLSGSKSGVKSNLGGSIKNEEFVVKWRQEETSLRVSEFE